MHSEIRESLSLNEILFLHDKRYRTDRELRDHKSDLLAIG